MEFQKEPGGFSALGEDGKLLAEITFPTGEDGVADIDHTFVDESLRGQGVASPAGAGRRGGSCAPGEAGENLLLVRRPVV